MNLNYSVKIRPEVEDRMYPTNSKLFFIFFYKNSKLFQVNSIYRQLSNGGSIFPWKSIWKVKVAPFAWTAVLGQTLTLDNLQRHGIVVVDWCFLCKLSKESVDHILLH